MVKEYRNLLDWVVHEDFEDKTLKDLEDTLTTCDHIIAGVADSYDRDLWPYFVKLKRILEREIIFRISTGG